MVIDLGRGQRLIYFASAAGMGKPAIRLRLVFIDSRTLDLVVGELESWRVDIHIQVASAYAKEKNGEGERPPEKGDCTYKLAEHTGLLADT